MQPSAKVFVLELELTPRGTIRVGNSKEVSVTEAIRGIRAREYKALDQAVGKVPEEWMMRTRKRWED